MVTRVFLFHNQSTWSEKGLNLYQIDVLSKPFNECERDKFTEHYFFFFLESKKNLTKSQGESDR
jgi:hypothetical protein